MTPGATGPNRRADDRTGRARAAPGRQKVRRRIAQGFGRGATRMRLNSGHGNVMRGADLLKKTTDVLNENLLRRALMEFSPKRRTQYSLSS